MQQSGRITKWNDQQGYGFITPKNGGKTVFFQISSLQQQQPRPSGGELVRYALEPQKADQPKALWVAIGPQAHPVPPQHPRPAKPPRQADGTTASAQWLLLFSASFLLGLFALAWFDLIPTFLFFAYLGLSLLAFIAYALDKSAALHGRWRTEERTLHGLALLGGWPGALCAQQILRHKTRKRSFQIVFRAATLLNLAALSVLLLTEPGQILLAYISLQIP